MAKDRSPIFVLAEANLSAHAHDCSGFVRAVAMAAGVPLGGIANHLLDYWNATPSWIKLGSNSSLASQMAAQGYLVVAGKKETRHGHVVIIVPGTQHGHAMGYWGSLGGLARRNSSLSNAWKHSDLETVQYFAFAVPTLNAKP